MYLSNNGATHGQRARPGALRESTATALIFKTTRRLPRSTIIRGSQIRYIRAVARFFEVLNGGALHPDYNLILKAASLHAARALDAHNEEAREHDARGGDVSRVLSEPDGLRNIRSSTSDGRGVQRHIARDGNRARAMEGQSSVGLMAVMPG